MKSIVILFGSEAEGQRALDEMESSIPEKDMDVRVVEVSKGHPPATEWTAIGLPVPAHGGVVPTRIGIADLDISKAERDYIFNRATEDMMILEVKTKDEYIDDVKRIVNMHNGQFYDEEK